MTDKRDTPPAETGRETIESDIDRPWTKPAAPVSPRELTEDDYNCHSDAPVSPPESKIPPSESSGRNQGSPVGDTNSVDKPEDCSLTRQRPVVSLGGRFCIHGVELIKWCKICDGTVSPEPPRCPPHRLVGAGDYGGTEAGTMCADCGIDAGDIGGAGTVGATPEPESKADQQWLHLVAKLNTIHAQLQHKPSHLKCGHRQEIGSILNAYREGDLSFDEAKLAAQSLPSPAPQDAERLAQRFHEAYERLAPQYGYETRNESAKPWSEVPEVNRRLMRAVCREILATSPVQPVGLPIPPIEQQHKIAQEIAKEHGFEPDTLQFPRCVGAIMQAWRAAQPVGSADKEQK